MPSCLTTKERQFIRDLDEWDIVKLHKKYTATYRRVMKQRLLEKRRFLDQDLLSINSVLDKLQTIWFEFDSVWRDEVHLTGRIEKIDMKVPATQLDEKVDSEWIQNDN